MRLGIFGGSFDPIHIGHLIIAEFAREYMKLDKVIFIPVGNPSHREDNLVSAIDRYNMVKIAISNNPYFEVSDIEISHKKLNYTYDTLLEIKNNYENSEIFEIIGEDSADYLHKWKNYNELLKMCKFLVFKREGFDYISNHDNIIVMNSPKISISATLIRNRIKNNMSIKYMVEETVEKYILENNLYKLKLTTST